MLSEIIHVVDLSLKPCKKDKESKVSQVFNKSGLSI